MSITKKPIESFYPSNRKEWRAWLKKNHHLKQSVWLVYYKKTSSVPTISYSDAVEEALCFGWIDSTKKKLNDESYIQFFSKRKPNSVWSKINKEKVKRLIENKLMAKAGLLCIDNAKGNGSWTILDDVEELKIPKDLSDKFKNVPGSNKYFLSLSKSVKKRILQWLVTAKRVETRENRIKEVAEHAAQNKLPKQFR